ncbi:hypothetical protein [Spirosoma oryzicola]|nr:hypothetical protein [Spirosoma oryzicola]UHG93791.1 hypothetical protein LQ777_25045 [Spirosoma oryzicola]
MLCALSLYPFSATDAEYTVMAPLLDKVTEGTYTGNYSQSRSPAGAKP